MRRIRNVRKRGFISDSAKSCGKIELWNMKYFFKFDLIPILFILICIIIVILIDRNI